ncbi:MAG: hypothetical protein ACK5JT_18195 [Hyphomicrobiaceae bacterium]
MDYGVMAAAAVHCTMSKSNRKHQIAVTSHFRKWRVDATGEAASAQGQSREISASALQPAKSHDGNRLAFLVERENGASAGT